MHAVNEYLSDPDARRALQDSLNAPYTAPVIRCAKFKITARCNLRCTFCQYWQMREPDEMSTSEIQRSLDQLRDMGCVKVHFSGGEATLRKDVFALLAHAASLGMKANLTTNGTLLDHDRAHQLLDAGTHSVSLSLDGPDARTHDSLRGVPGAFERTTKAIRLLARIRDRRGSRLKLRLNTVLTRHNYTRLADVTDLAAELGMTDVIPMPVDERLETAEHRLSRHDIERFNTHVAPIAAEVRRAVGFSTAPHLIWPFGRSDRDLLLAAEGRYARGYFKEHLCHVPWLHMFITWNGDVYLCCMARGKTEPFGNLRRQSVAEVFQGEGYRQIRGQFRRKMPSVCHRCDMFLAENAVIEQALSPANIGPGAPRRTPDNASPGESQPEDRTAAPRTGLRSGPESRSAATASAAAEMPPRSPGGTGTSEFVVLP